ncbi:hypothetical protein BFJ66_g10710 [Fusarium oxysporum f. sp. cepae]|uniref:Uncharacterized protein n=1 Tax=Fusarium oxysporum f. sp. cepae TaxID=396571 RepID=A0A3L6MS87_FUSOX|nr:hypothetical protein BFJ65_g18108 [Fusarium oxysporum f. sp. cepae]RKK42019.1 hypothetical protein BFJ66_g10710 [Fusarium oxysporum f. sp. cepae]
MSPYARSRPQLGPLTFGQISQRPPLCLPPSPRSKPLARWNQCQQSQQLHRRTHPWHRQAIEISVRAHSLRLLELVLRDVNPIYYSPFKKSECEARHPESAESDYANSYARLRTCLDRNGMIGRRQSVRRHGRLGEGDAIRNLH